jgi:hypothetical protein
MRNYDVVRRSRALVGIVVALAAIGVLLLMFASSAVARTQPIGPPTTSWSVSKILQGAGEEVLGRDTTRVPNFRKRLDIGHQGSSFVVRTSRRTRTRRSNGNSVLS